GFDFDAPFELAEVVGVASCWSGTTVEVAAVRPRSARGMARAAAARRPRACVKRLKMDTCIEPLISPLPTASNSDNRSFSSRMTRLSGSSAQVRVNGVQMHPTSLPGGRLGAEA